MKKILGIVVLGLFYNNICIAETISDRLSKIEDRLYKIEKLLESLEEIQEQTDSSNKKKKK